jgi:hypothetical protein
MGEKPAPKTPSLTKRSSSSMSASSKQQSILGFFSKSSQSGTPNASSKSSTKKPTTVTTTNSSPCLKENTNLNSLQLNRKRSSNITPIPSSDAIEPSSSQENHSDATVKVFKASLPSPVTPAEVPTKQAVPLKMVIGSSPSRKVYAVYPIFLFFFPPNQSPNAMMLTSPQHCRPRKLSATPNHPTTTKTWLCPGNPPDARGQWSKMMRMTTKRILKPPY